MRTLGIIGMIAPGSTVDPSAYRGLPREAFATRGSDAGDAGIPLLDATRIHIRRAVAALLS